MLEDNGQTESADDTPVTSKGPHPLKRQRKRAPPPAAKKGGGVICINEDSNGDGSKPSHPHKGGVIKQWGPTMRVKNPWEKLLRAMVDYQQSEGQLELRLLL